MMSSTSALKLKRSQSLQGSEPVERSRNLFGLLWHYFVNGLGQDIDIVPRIAFD